MPAVNTATQYGYVTKLFHWLIALGIFLVIPLGIIANRLPYDTSEQLADKAWLFSLHKTVGVAIFLVALARIAWAVSQPKPDAMHPDRKGETLLAEIVHWLLYGSLILVPLSGWVHHAATEGFAPIWWPFGQNLPLVPESQVVADAAAGLHVVFERVLVLSLFLHIAGAVKHAVIDKDGTLARMWFGTSETAPQSGSRHRIVPAVLAVAVWAAALGTGAALGVYSKGSSAFAAIALQDVESEWQVQDGTLAITIEQLGSTVRGTFSDWTADISFDETVTDGNAGQVAVEIAIGSLTLGSVTNQAMQADYFNVEDFPTARFTADILVEDGTYTANGKLSLKGVEQPMSFPFEMTVEDSAANMSASAVLNRQAFNIGESMTDESQLGYEVGVEIAVTAMRPNN